MIISLEQVMRNAADQVDLSDITTKTVTRRGWVRTPDGRDVFEVQFAVNLTQAETDAVTLRLATVDANQETTEARAWQAADGLRTIRDSTGALTATQLSNAVRLLARVVLYLLRLQLRRTDAVETEPGTTTTTTATATQTAIQAAKKT